ncbi:MAG: hypothetical protein E6R03_01680 [Hyphomicrobiaceae bacterium]|nr:MAG: hypothetical protein E6R03_01680 [Hyphomicrobiaceae bacterium]
MRTILTLLILFPLLAESQSAVRMRFGAGGVPSGGGGGGTSFDTNGLLLVWRFDESTAGDKTSSDAYALVLTSTNSVASGSGVLSNSARFSRSANMILGMSTTNLVEVATNMNFSIGAWVNLSSFPSSGQIYGIVSKDYPGVNTKVEYALYAEYNAANTYQFSFLTGTNATAAGQYKVTSANTLTATNQWVFVIAGREQSSGNWSNWISVDGKAKEWVESPIGPAATTANFIGGSLGTSTHLMNGRIDHLQFWRTNVNMTQIGFLTNNPPQNLP